MSRTSPLVLASLRKSGTARTCSGAAWRRSGTDNDGRVIQLPRDPTRSQGLVRRIATSRLAERIPRAAVRFALGLERDGEKRCRARESLAGRLSRERWCFTWRQGTSRTQLEKLRRLSDRPTGPAPSVGRVPDLGRWRPRDREPQARARETKAGIHQRAPGRLQITRLDGTELLKVANGVHAGAQQRRKPRKSTLEWQREGSQGESPAVQGRPFQVSRHEPDARPPEPPVVAQETPRLFAGCWTHTYSRVRDELFGATRATGRADVVDVDGRSL
ncbi:hypothetical protein DMC30DRAFT_58559 [Rhodotorula diobovata]|uniref:Uncharacterized protein n=1 Tax=Rhodotorula diobovata TaxID=5288 RepID=A0A5C5FNH6_9BASI|nr:hypothetical protein DMC30DRAFT_58559 [Rhodotorula diobovata]